MFKSGCCSGIVGTVERITPLDTNYRQLGLREVSRWSRRRLKLGELNTTCRHWAGLEQESLNSELKQQLSTASLAHFLICFSGPSFSWILGRSSWLTRSQDVSFHVLVWQLSTSPGGAGTLSLAGSLHAWCFFFTGISLCFSEPVNLFFWLHWIFLGDYFGVCYFTPCFSQGIQVLPSAVCPAVRAVCLKGDSLSSTLGPCAAFVLLSKCFHCALFLPSILRIRNVPIVFFLHRLYPLVIFLAF